MSHRSTCRRSELYIGGAASDVHSSSATTVNWKPTRSSIRRYKVHVDDVRMAWHCTGQSKILWVDDNGGDNSLQTLRQIYSNSISSVINISISTTSSSSRLPGAESLWHITFLHAVGRQSDRPFLDQSKTFQRFFQSSWSRLQQIVSGDLEPWTMNHVSCHRKRKRFIKREKCTKIRKVGNNVPEASRSNSSNSSSNRYL